MPRWAAREAVPLGEADWEAGWFDDGGDCLGEADEAWRWLPHAEVGSPDLRPLADVVVVFPSSTSSCLSPPLLLSEDAWEERRPQGASSAGKPREPGGSTSSTFSGHNSPWSSPARCSAWTALAT